MNLQQQTRLEETYDRLEDLEFRLGATPETTKMHSHLNTLGFLETEALVEQILDVVNERINELFESVRDTDPI